MKFNYQARTKEGDIQAGTIEASSQETAAKVLQDYGLVVTFLEKAGQEPFYSKSLKFFERVTRKDLVLFSRELATMFKSEVSLIESLRAIAQETKNLSFKEKILKLSEIVEGGTSFSEALTNFPKLFSPFYVNLVKSGESSGKLSEVLDYLADHLEREYALLQKISVMLIYPAFVLIVFGVVLAVMSLVIIPKLVGTMGVDPSKLPLITKIVIGFTSTLRRYFIIVLALIIGLVVAGTRSYKTVAGKKRLDTMFLKIFLVGDMLKKVYLARFAENLSTLISGGLPIVRALDITAGVVNNYRYQEIILEAKEEVRKGETISHVLKKYPEFVPPFFTQMVLVGEKTGRLSETLLNTVAFYQREIERAAEALMSIIEPLLILILGGGVGILIAAILLPMYQMESMGSM